MMEDSGDPFDFDFTGEPRPTNKRLPFVKGDVVDHRYLIQAVAGWGTFGRVYCATRLEDERQFALKCFETSNGSPMKASVAAEFERLQSLTHPHIPSVFETFVEPSTQRWCLVMQWIDGIGFHELVHTPMLDSPLRAARLMADIADALDYLHGEGWFHRDLKPSNMLVDQEERAWLVDFGTSKSGDEMFDVIGESTPRYSSSATGNAFTWTSEVYPLGLILKELFTGPANRENSPEASFVNEILDGIAQPEFPNSVPAELQTICAKSLQQRRVDAYISAGEFADDLRSFVADTVATGNLENRLMGGENRVAAWRAGRFVGEATRFQEQTTVTLDSIKEHGLTDVATQLVNQLVVSGVGFREAVVFGQSLSGTFRCHSQYAGRRLRVSDDRLSPWTPLRCAFQRSGNGF